MYRLSRGWLSFMAAVSAMSMLCMVAAHSMSVNVYCKEQNKDGLFVSQTLSKAKVIYAGNGHPIGVVDLDVFYGRSEGSDIVTFVIIQRGSATVLLGTVRPLLDGKPSWSGRMVLEPLQPGQATVVRNADIQGDFLRELNNPKGEPLADGTNSRISIEVSVPLIKS